MANQEQPNIRFVGKPQEFNGKTIEPEPFEFINNGNAAYVLPPCEKQSNGFWWHIHGRRSRRHHLLLVDNL